MSEPGPIGEEATRLLEAALSWLRERSSSEAGEHEPLTCRVCPLCRLLGAARGVQPETFEHILAAAESMLAAARTLVDSREAPRPAGVSHIDIG